MALAISIPTSFGIPATYWHIFSIDHNRPQKACQVVMAGYVDAESREAGHQPLATAVLALAPPDFPGDADGLSYGAVYERIKAIAATPQAPVPYALFRDAANA